jgi:hypothetical protein
VTRGTPGYKTLSVMIWEKHTHLLFAQDKERGLRVRVGVGVGVRHGHSRVEVCRDKGEKGSGWSPVAIGL